MTRFTVCAPVPRVFAIGTFRLHISFSLLAVCLLAWCVPGLQAQTASFSGSPSTIASGLLYISGVAVDSSGNVYIADQNAKTVTKLLSNSYGSKTVIANTSSNGSGFSPVGVAVDSSGNVYIGDVGDQQVVEAPAGCTATTDILNACQTVLANTSSNGSGFSPVGVAVDSSGNVYIGDVGDQQVVKAPAGCTATNDILNGCQTVLASNVTNGGAFNPIGVAVDSSGNVYIADDGDSQVVKCTSGCQTVLASALTNGGSFSPTGVAVDSAGSVYIADGDNEVVDKAPAGCAASACQTVLANTSIEGPNFAPLGVAVDSGGNVYVADNGNEEVEKVQQTVNFASESVPSTSSALTLYFTFSSGGSLSSSTPYQVLTQGAAGLDFAAAASGTTCGGAISTGNSCAVNVTFTPRKAGLRSGAVVLYNSSNSPIATAYIDGTGTGPQIAFGPGVQSTLGGGLTGARGVAVDGAGNVYAGDYLNSVVEKIPPGCASSACETPIGASWSTPAGVAVDGAGNVYVADYGTNDVWKVPPGCASLSCETQVGAGYAYPLGVAVDGSGNVYVANYDGGDVIEAPWTGASYGAQSTVGSGWSRPAGVAVDASGDVFVSDQGLQTVKEVPAGCTSSSCEVTLTASGSWNDPAGMTTDGVGSLYVENAGAIVKFPPTCTTAACSSSTTVGTTGNWGVAVDGSGNIYAGNTGTGANDVVKVDLGDAPSLTFATTTEAGDTDTTDGPQTVTVTNIGNETLTFSTLGSGPNPSYAAGFPENTSDGNLCSAVDNANVEASHSCDISANFAPTGAGANIGSVVLTDNALNGTNVTQSITFTGMGTDTAAQLAFSTPPAADILTGGNAGSAITVNEEDSAGALANSATDTITLTVTGPNSYSQTYTATASGGVATFNLSSAALTTVGSYAYTATSGSLTQAVATETMLAGSLNFFSVNVGSPTAGQAVTVYIATAGTLNSINVLTKGASGLDFTQAASPNGGTCSTGTAYTVGQACTVNVIFSPRSPGLRLGAVVLENSSGNVLGEVLLSGTGIGPQLALTPSTISTVAGNGGTGCSSPTSACGDGELATSADLLGPNAVAVDSAGNIYIADSTDNRIREVNASTGIITTIAGTGASGYSGDGGPATQAKLGGPKSVLVDGAGNLFIGDFGNNRVRKVNASTGIITTVAGNGTACSSTSACGDGGPATSANLENPLGMALDGAGNLYIADNGNPRILEVSASTGIITTIAGTGTACASPTSACGDGGSATSAELKHPFGIAFDSVGNLYIADSSDNRIREVNASTGNITTVVGTGTACTSSTSACGDGESAASAGLNTPDGIAFDSAGDLYIADSSDNVIREVNASTGIITTVAGSVPNGPGFGGDGGAATSAALNAPAGVALDSAGNLYIADTVNKAIREVNVSAVPTISFATPTSIGSTDTTDGAQTVTVANDGNAALTLSGLTVPASWTAASGTGYCSSTSSLAEGGSCSIAITFAPQTAGTPLTGDVTLTDNASSSPQQIALSGTAIAVASQLAFSTPPTANILAGGNAGGTITVNEDDSIGTLVTTAADTIKLTVTGPNSYSQTYTATASGGVATFNLSSVALTTTGSYTYTASSGSLTQAVASETLVAGSLNLSSENVGSPAAGQAVTVYIATAGTLNSINVFTKGASGLDFTQAASPNGGTCSTGTAYTVGQACTVNVIFSPRSPGLRLGAVVLTNSSGAVLGQVLLSGKGVGPLVTFPTNLTVNALGSGFSAPISVAVDASGDVFVIDGSNVEEIVAGTGGNAAGVVSTTSTVKIVGNGFDAPRGLAVDGAGDVFVGDFSHAEVKEIVAGTGGNAPGLVSSASTVIIVGTNSIFSQPCSIAVDGSGDVFVADATKAYVFEIEAGTGGNAPGVVSSTSTVITVGSGMSASQGLGVDGSGDVFVAGTGNGTIYEVEAGTGGNAAGLVSSSSTVVIVGTSSNFNVPCQVIVDGGGDVFVADFGQGKVKEIVAGTGGNAAGVVSTSSTVLILGSGFNKPYGVAVDGSDNVFVTDESSEVKEVPLAAAPSLTFASTNVGATSSAQTVTVANDGNASLTLSGLTVPTNWTQVASGGTDCSATSEISQGGSCNVALSFSPTATGNPLTGSVTLTDNSLNTTQTIGLSGTATAAVPGAPTIGTATGGNAQATVPFTAPASNGGASITGYTATSTPGGLTGVCAASPCIVTGLTNGTAYTFTVTATNSVGTGSASAASNSVTPATVPGAPTIGTATAGNVQATVSFTAPASNGGATITSYTATSSPSGITGSCSASPCTVAGLTNGTAYTFTVTATNSAGTGSASAASNSATPVTVPGAPTIGTATTGNAQATITFTAPASNGGASITGYTATSTPGGLTGVCAASPCIVTGLTNGTAYTFTVTATNSVGTGSASAASNSATPATVPGAPTIGTATASVAAGGGQQATISFTAPASDGGALITSYTATSNPGGLTGTCSGSPCTVAGLTAGSSYTFTVTATNLAGTGPASTASAALAISIPNLVVTTAADDAGTASNCTAQSSTTTGTDNACSLRDALLFAANAHAAKIYFDTTKFVTATTITLTSGSTLTIPSYTTIQGLTTGSGATLENLVTVDGGSGNYGQFSVFTVSAGTMNASIANLIIQNGSASGTAGGGIMNYGALTVTGSTLSNNSGTYGGGILDEPGSGLTVAGSLFQNNSTSNAGGGAILNQTSSTMTVTGSAFIGNSSNANGGGILNDGTATVTDSTFNSNSAKLHGGGIFSSGATTTVTNSTIAGNTGTAGGGGIASNGGTFTIGNSIVAGNTSSSNGPDAFNVSGSFSDGGGNLIGNGTGMSEITNGTNGDLVGTSASPINPMLFALGNNGGTTETMLPLPGSPAICAGLSSAASSAGVTADQRGVALNAGGYCSSGSVDIGAVQTDYSLSFTTQPQPISPATAILMNVDFAAAVTLEESGSAFTAGSVSIPLTLTSNPGGASLMNGTVSTTSGAASYSTLQVNQAGTSDTLTANLALSPAASPALSISAISSSFGVNQGSTTTTAASATATYSAGAQSLALSATVTSGSGTVNAGTVTFTLLSGTTVIGAATTSGTVNGGAASVSYALPAGTTAGSYTIQAVYNAGGEFGSSSDSSHTLVIGQSTPTINWTAPSAITYGTALSATQLGATASFGGNNVAGAFNYSPAVGMVLTAGPHTLSVTFTPTDTTDYTTVTQTVSLTVNQATPTINWTGPSAITYGTALSATQLGATASFGGNSVAGAFNYSPAVGTVLTAGPHTLSVTFTPTDTTDYTTVTQTVQLTVNQATVSLSGPAVTLTYGSAGSANVTVTGQSGTGTAVPSGSVTYSINGGALQTAALVNGTAALVIPGTLDAGNYSIPVSYAGDANYQAGAGTVGLTVHPQTTSEGALTSLPASPVYGGQVQLQGVFAPAAANVPATAFNFLIDHGTSNSVVVPAVSYAGGAVTASYGQFTAGPHTVALQFNGTTDYAASTSGPITILIGQATPTISWTPAATIGYGNSLSGLLNAAAMYAGQSVPGTFSYSAQMSGGTAVPITAATSLPAGSYTLTASFTPTDTTTYKTATASVGLTVNQAGVSGVVLTSSVNPVLVTNAITLVATLSSPISTPTGSVSFFDGSSPALLGTVTLSGGIARLSVSTLAVGTHSITAVYSGDVNFLGVTSTALNEQVEDFNLSISTTGGSGSGSSSGTPSAIIMPGGTANYSFTLTPTGLTTFPSPITLSVGGLPAGATYTLSPPTIAAGEGETNVQLAISVPSATASLRRSEPFGRGLIPMALGMLLLPFSRRMRRSAGRLGRMTALLLLLMASAAGIAGLTGCGSSTGYFAQPQQTYNVTVTATSGALSHSTIVTLTVQ